MKAHLTNHVATTANMLNNPRAFDALLMKEIDSINVVPMKNKTIQVYGSGNEKIYENSDTPNDTIHITNDILNRTRADNKYFFTVGNREAIACYDTKNSNRPVILAAAFDEEGKRNLKHLEIILLITFV
ncbi:MAG: hypothetical protein ABJB05_16565, partial [Parafilimonas sp.]